jgi:hypothetical protein
MYPSRQLTELAARKTLLQARIAVRRWECASAAAQIARPIALIDRGIALWRRISPVIKILGIPAGIFLVQFFKRRGARTAAKKSGKMAAVMAALPMILRGVKMMQEMRGAHRARTGHATSRAGL